MSRSAQNFIIQDGPFHLASDGSLIWTNFVQFKISLLFNKYVVAIFSLQALNARVFV